ncbi:hypothetical protein CDD83_2843 [Cordyceps sp. RAO-2017]|nr:hypothetical protein CDD83_2843 [Cordyceps sp. RAO-2017]
MRRWSAGGEKAAAVGERERERERCDILYTCARPLGSSNGSTGWRQPSSAQLSPRLVSLSLALLYPGLGSLAGSRGVEMDSRVACEKKEESLDDAVASRAKKGVSLSVPSSRRPFYIQVYPPTSLALPPAVDSSLSQPGSDVNEKPRRWSAAPLALCRRQSLSQLPQPLSAADNLSLSLSYGTNRPAAETLAVLVARRTYPWPAHRQLPHRRIRSPTRASA